MIILDTDVIIDFFADRSESVAKIIQEFESGELELSISVITLSEVFYIISRKLGDEDAKIIVENIKSWVVMLPVTSEIAEKAGEIKFLHAGKGKKGMPMADAIIAATALINNAQLITSDSHFDKIRGLRIKKP
jgi:predicted nucleic acid-binding protein